MDILITGSTGMVGRSVLNECIKDKRVDKIYLINRVPINIKSPKIIEFIVDDFLKVGDLKKKIKNYACNNHFIINHFLNCFLFYRFPILLHFNGFYNSTIFDNLNQNYVEYFS